MIKERPSKKEIYKEKKEKKRRIGNSLYSFLFLWYNVYTYGDDLVSTGIVEHRWQVECPRHGHKKINANKIKNAVATLFGANQAVAFA